MRQVSPAPSIQIHDLQEELQAMKQPRPVSCRGQQGKQQEEKQRHRLSFHDQLEGEQATRR
jgi:hypothetical protein